jgi:hypothetical protein
MHALKNYFHICRFRIGEANIQNQDYVVLNTPAPAQWPSTASLGELIPLTVSIRDYLDLLAEVRKQAYDFINSLWHEFKLRGNSFFVTVSTSFRALRTFLKAMYNCAKSF